MGLWRGWIYKRYPNWVMVLQPSLSFYKRTDAWVCGRARYVIRRMPGSRLSLLEREKRGFEMAMGRARYMNRPSHVTWVSSEEKSILGT
jgi:hypothetical protein